MQDKNESAMSTSMIRVENMENTSRLEINSRRNDSRIQRLLTIQELLLEYSMVIIVLGCFLVLSLSVRLFRDFSEDKVAWVRNWKGDDIQEQSLKYELDVLEPSVRLKEENFKQRKMYWSVCQQTFKKPWLIIEIASLASSVAENYTVLKACKSWKWEEKMAK